MDKSKLAETQGPLKSQYKDDPESAVVTLKADGDVDGSGIACRVQTSQALVACAGVTLRAVSTAMGVEIRGGNVHAEGDLDFRGTLGVAKDAPVGFREVRLRFDIDTDADADTLATLHKLTERYCVVFQTLAKPPELSVEMTPRQTASA